MQGDSFDLPPSPLRGPQMGMREEEEEEKGRLLNPNPKQCRRGMAFENLYDSHSGGQTAAYKLAGLNQRQATEYIARRRISLSLSRFIETPRQFPWEGGMGE